MSRRQTFHSFGKLPAEIRLEIWKIISHTSRILELYVLYISTSLFYPHCRNPIPAVLQVCQESRKEGLRYYKAVESPHYSPLSRKQPRNQQSPSWVTKQVPALFYINLDRDIVYFNQWNSIIGRYKFLEYLEEKMMAMLKTVAFDLRYRRNGEEDLNPLRTFSTKPLRVVDTLVLVLPTDIEGNKQKELRFAKPRCERLMWNMTPLERGILDIWQSLLDAYLHDTRSCISFEEMGLQLISFWEKSKIEKSLSGETAWVHGRIPEVRVMEVAIRSETRGEESKSSPKTKVLHLATDA